MPRSAAGPRVANRGVKAAANTVAAAVVSMVPAAKDKEAADVNRNRLKADSQA